MQVMGHFLDALMGELSEGEAQRSVLDLATQNLRCASSSLTSEITFLIQVDTPPVSLSLSNNGIINAVSNGSF